MVFQPIIDIQPGLVIGGESLIRWQHPGVLNYLTLELTERSIVANVAETQVTLQKIQEMGIKTTAEGIETAEQLLSMKTLGCDSGQGYFLSRPIEKRVFVSILLDGLVILNDT